MENEGFTHENSQVHSPKPFLSFQNVRFLKNINNLNIPDTIPEQSSTELSEKSLKMEAASKSTFKCMDGNIELPGIQSSKSDESNTSTITAVDNSYLINCEKKLLESSGSDSENKSLINNLSLKSGYFNELARKLGFNNETISTPKNVLRNQISMLSNEIAESEEFHDLEIQILKQENLKNDEDITYSQLIEKYSELLELYSTLKNEYDEYRKEHEKLQYKTADCLEVLCSQIEASDSSLNFSSASFASFNTDIKSSTMMGNISEVEATIMNDATFLDKDPLSITQDGEFKTPKHLPFKSVKKLFPQSSSSNNKSTFKETANDLNSKVDEQVEFNFDYNLRILDLETALCDKVQEVKNLEQRLFKLEDFMSTLRSEHERISATLTAENQNLKKDLSQKAEQLEDLVGKLFTETIGLNPSLKDSLIDVSGTKLLTVFIETILESCKSVQNNLINEHNLEKTEWEAVRKMDLASIENLQSQVKSLKDEISEKHIKLVKLEELENMSENLKEQLIQAKNIISVKDEEIRLLQSVDSNKTNNDLDSVDEIITKLQTEFAVIEKAKNEIENRCSKLEKTILDLEEDVKNEKKVVDNMEKSVITYKIEKEKLNQLLQQSEARAIELETDKIKQEEVQNDLRKEIEMYQNENMLRLKQIFNLLHVGQKLLPDFFLNISNETSETLSKLISENIEMNSDVSELLALYTETVFTCYEEAKKNICKEFRIEKSKWEENKNEDITVIENLKNQLKFLSENNKDKENQLSKLIFENEENEKLCESLKKKILESENTITARNERILELETHLRNMKEELYKQFNEEKAEWESKKTSDSILIENLQNQITSLNNKNNENEKKLSKVILETEDLKKVCDSFEEKLKDAESALLSRNEEILMIEAQKASLKEELFRQFKHEKEEWELNKKADLTRIENFQIQINSLNERISEYQQKLVNFDELQKSHENLKQSLLEAENIISRRDEEINQLKSYNSDISQFQKDLVSAKETIERLESEMSEIEVEKKEIKNRCLDLEKAALELEEEIGNKRKLLSEMEKSVSFYKNEKESLNELLKQSEAKTVELLTELENSKKKQLETHDTLTTEIKTLKDENNFRFQSFCNILNEGKNILSKVNLNVFSESKENLVKLISENMEMTFDTEELLSAYVDAIINCCERLREKLLAEHAEERAQWEFNTNSEIINRLQSQITSLSKQNESHEIKVSHMISENEDLKKLSDTLRQKLAESENAISSRNERILFLEEAETNLKQEKVEWEAKRNDDLQEIKNLHCQIKSLNDKNDESENKLSNFESKNEEFKKLCDSLKQKLTEYETIITDCQEKIKFLESQDKNEKDELLKKFGQEKIEWETNKTDYITKIENLQSQVISLNEKNGDNEAKLSNIVSENEEFKKLCESLNEKLSESEKIITVRNEQILLLEAHEDDLKKELLQQFNNEKSEWETRKNSDLKLIENLQNQIKSLSEKNESSQVELSNMISENEEFKKLCEILKEKLSESENIVTVRNEQILLLEAHENDLKKELHQQFNNEKSEWETRKNSDLKLIENLQNQIQSLSEKNESSQVELSNMVSENEEFKKLCESLKEKLLETENILSSRDEQILLLEAQEANLKQEFNEEKSEWEAQKNNDFALIQNLETQVKSLNEKNESIESKLNAAINENENLQKLCDTLRDQVSEYENMIIASNEQILRLEGEEANLKQVKVDLAAAEEAKTQLESRILKIEAEKLEMESLCLEYQKTTLDLQSLLAAKVSVTKDIESKNLLIKDKNNIINKLQKIIKEIKEKLNVDLSNSILMECSELEINTFSREIEEVAEEILKSLDELQTLKERAENENSTLKQQLHQCEEVIGNHELELKDVKKELQNKETMFLHEISLLKKEKENLSSLSIQINDLEEHKKNLTEILLDVQFCLDISSESMSKVISGHLESRKVFMERIKDLTKSKTESLKAENKNLKYSNDNLKEKIKELSKAISESSNNVKEEIAMMNNSLPLSMTLRSRPGKNVDLCARRLDKLEEINHSLTELMTRVLTMTEFSHVDKLKFCSVRDFPNISKQVVTHFNKLNEKINEFKAANAKLDEECDSYAKTIKDLKQEAVIVWKTNKEKVEALNSELSKFREEKKILESEKEDLLMKISKLDSQYQKLKDGVKSEDVLHNCNCGKDLKKITEMKRTLLIKEQKILELQDIETQNGFYKSQIKYLENALEQEKKKTKEEKEKNKKLQNEMNELTKNEKVDSKKSEENQILEQLRMCGSLSGGVVQEFVDKEKIRKLAKDIGLLKELCRARYAEIKRLETENATLRNMTTKNSNQMDSPIRPRTYNTRSKVMMKEIWKPGVDGKENNNALV